MKFFFDKHDWLKKDSEKKMNYTWNIKKKFMCAIKKKKKKKKKEVLKVGET